MAERVYRGPTPEGAIQSTLGELKSRQEQEGPLRGPRGSRLRVRFLFALWQPTGILDRIDGRVVTVHPEHGGMGTGFRFHQGFDSVRCWTWTVDQQRAAQAAQELAVA